VERILSLASVGNFRDIGGYATRDGATIRLQQVFRSGTLQRITSADVDHAVDLLGIRTVVDLRTASDFDRHRDFGLLIDHPAITRVHLPSGPNDPAADIRAAFDSGRNPVEVAYETLARDYGDGVAAAISGISAALDAPLIFHCSLGKDRTGVLAAILLELLGVTEDDVVADYQASEEHAAKALARSRERGTVTPKNEAVVGAMMAVHPTALRSMLAGIRTAHGSVESYLLTHGLRPEEIDRLRNALVS
jgi:hypothetical protein